MLRSCPLCGAARVRAWRRGWDRSHLLSRQQFTYSRCRNCGLRFASERPSESEIRRFYPETYYDPRAEPTAQPSLERSRRSKSISSALAALNAWIDERLADPLPARLEATYRPPTSGAVLLDYGCGSPAFLDRAREQGWSTIGVDISERVLREVREHGHRALPADLDAWGSVPDSSVTVARVNHVIEHLYRPRDVLTALFEKLEPDGVLHVSTPNPASWTSALLRSRWLGLDVPRHILLYPPPVLASLLEQVGFRRVEIVQEVLTKDAARSLGYVLHDLGRLPHDGILTMAERPGLAAALHAPAKLAARAGASDRIHAFAEK